MTIFAVKRTIMSNAINILNREEDHRVVEAIKQAELNTSGEIKVHIENHCRGDVEKRSLVVFNQLKLNENGLEIIDGQTPIQQNRLVNDYLGIPAELHFSLGEQWKSSLSVDAFFGRRIRGLLRTRGPEDNYKDWAIEDAASLFNPWKLEVGFSVNTNLIGFIHGIRVYTNLLPEYNKAVTTEKFRSIGVEIRL